MRLTKRQEEVLAAYADASPGFVPPEIFKYTEVGNNHRRAVRKNALRNMLIKLQYMGLVRFGDLGDVEVTEEGRKVLSARRSRSRLALRRLRDAVARYGYSMETEDGKDLFSAMQEADEVLERSGT